MLRVAVPEFHRASRNGSGQRQDLLRPGRPAPATAVFQNGLVGSTRLSIGGHHIDTRPGDFTAAGIPPVNPHPLLPRGYPSITTNPFPEELKFPPLSWRLSSKLTKHFQDTVALGISYARFAHDTGARFSEDPANPLFGINNTVSQTKVEAVEDDAGRLYALWLRTPEPVDWRRVSLSLRIRHLEGSSPCPDGYAYRSPLDLDIEALPSPDGSSAFLVGRLAGLRTRLPRGEFALTISFNPHEPELPRLRPSDGVASPEILELKFLNRCGPAWPLPVEEVSVPAGVLEALTGPAGPSQPFVTDILNEATPILSRNRLKPATNVRTGNRMTRRRQRKTVLGTENHLKE